MWSLGPLGFTTPLLLWALVALPALWWLLRATPPLAKTRVFPALTLLLGLRDKQVQAETTPWWLLLLRMAALAAVIIGFAGPVWRPEIREIRSAPVLILLDGSWAEARDWPRRIERIEAELDASARAGRRVALVSLTDLPQGAPVLRSAEDWRARLPALQPAAIEPSEAALAWLQTHVSGPLDTLWLSDGLARPMRAQALAHLEGLGQVQIFETPRPVLALSRPKLVEGVLQLDLLRSGQVTPLEVNVLAFGPDPAGGMRELARVAASLAAGEARHALRFDLPPELRNRIQRFEIEGTRGAGAVALADDATRRRKVALITGGAEREGLQLLSQLHYLRQALAPVSDLQEGGLSDLLLTAPDVVVLADVARLTFLEVEELQAWIAKGGLLLRFAGPRMAAAQGTGEDDPLLPVRLRAGGRSVGGAMSWGEPRSLAPFAPESPFAGLTIPEDVAVTAQILAEPDPDLAAASLAALADGTPLVTRKRIGQGQIVLYHVTANAEWSSLPLSGLFVQMLERLAVSARLERPEAGTLEGQNWQAEYLLDGFGRLHSGARLAGQSGAALAEALRATLPSAEVPPGLYTAAGRQIAVNVIGEGRELSPAIWPEHLQPETGSLRPERSYKGEVLAAGIVLLLLDMLATLALSGRLRRGATMVIAALALWLPAPQSAFAEDARALEATRNLVLGYVTTGEAKVDEISDAGLRGLSRILTQRTTVEPAAPIGVDLEADELAFYPFLYWPVTADFPMPSPAAYRKLNQYLQTGGLILFDTRDGDLADIGGATPEATRLQLLAAPLNIPPLAPIPEDHVLTRTFYLLQDFPGRHAGRSIWVEAAPIDAERAEGMPFRNLNDGVTPVVIGGNDWASAWAVDRDGVPLLPVGRGFGGERQREIAWRFGVNLIMHVLTGNYKSDQVHVPALLERLGQ